MRKREANEPHLPKSVVMKLPFVFRAEFAESLHKPLSGVGPVHHMKEAAGRERDLIDLRELRLFMSREGPEESSIDWRLTTWKGSRREQLRRWSELSWNEILQAQEEMAELANDLNPSASGLFSSAVREDSPG